MAFIEQSHLRTQRTRTYQDSLDPQKFAIDATLTTLHYESTLDSGVYDTPIDCTPTRIDNASADGWRITANGWHYFLGRDLTNHGTEDGWIGFGGRQGSHWFKFRLLRAGYLRWSDRTWADVGGAPAYTRTNLIRQINSLTLPTLNESIPVECIAAWSNLWTTPGGGSVSAKWRIDGDWLKEEITVNSAARSWITANRGPGWAFPGEPLNNVWFGFVFRLDWSDVPRRLRNGVVIGPEDDIADDGVGIELRDALDRLLAFMPVDEVSAGDQSAPLRKRLYHDSDGNDYLLVGVRCDMLAGLPAGDLVFDPTIDTSVGVGADDGRCTVAGGNYTNSQTQILLGNVEATGYISFTRFANLTISTGATIDVAYFSCSANADNSGATCRVQFEAEDAATPAAPADGAAVTGRTATTATVDWNPVPSFTSGTWYNSPSLVGIIQELVDSYASSFNDGTADILLYEVDDGSTAEAIRTISAYEDGAALAPKLHIEYTEAGGTTYNQSISGGVTPSATLINQAQKVLVGSVTPTASLVNQGQKALAGTITPTGGLLNQTQKILGGSLTPLGQLLNQTQKVLSGNVTPSGVLTATKTALISLVGSLTPSGVLTKETQKVLSGTITPVGSIFKQIGKILTGALTPIGVMVASLVSTNLESTFKGMFRGMFRRMK